MEKITKAIKVLPHQKCLVLNYRRRPAVWEKGTVKGIKISIGTYHGEGGGKLVLRNTYDVILDRKAGGVIWLYVGDDGIHSIKK